MTEAQLKRQIEGKIMIEMATQKRQRKNLRSDLRSQGLPCDPTTSESDSEAEEKKKEEEKLEEAKRRRRSTIKQKRLIIKE